jgi:hypothetical protein
MSHCLIARNLFAVGLWTTLALVSGCAGAAQNEGEPIAGRDAITYAPAALMHWDLMHHEFVDHFF